MHSSHIRVHTNKSSSKHHQAPDHSHTLHRLTTTKVHPSKPKGCDGLQHVCVDVHEHAALTQRGGEAWEGANTVPPAARLGAQLHGLCVVEHLQLTRRRLLP